MELSRSDSKRYTSEDASTAKPMAIYVYYDLVFIDNMIDGAHATGSPRKYIKFEQKTQNRTSQNERKYSNTTKSKTFICLQFQLNICFSLMFY